jgi:hypothetical protein
MFEQIWKHLPVFKQNHEQENTTQVVPIEAGNTILFLYDEVDCDLWYDLAPHINTLILRLPESLVWKYYLYPVQRRSENQYATFMSDLQQTFLFIPCTSATFLVRWLSAKKSDARLASLLAQTYTQPIPLRAAHGVSQSILAQPLAAYPAGAERDNACVAVVAALEEKLLSYHRMRESTHAVAPVTGLAETASSLLLATQAHRRRP